MTVLAFISEIGVPEGNLLSSSRLSGEEVIFYHVLENRFYPRTLDEAPIWLSDQFISAHHVLTERYFEKLIEKHHISVVVALGLAASEYATNVVQCMPVHPLLFPGDLDFSSRRKKFTDQARSVFNHASHLYLADRWEMEKALSHGSTVPHLKYPVEVATGTKILSDSRADTRVALIHPALVAGDRLEAVLSQYEKELQRIGFHGVRIDVRNLYSSVDLEMGRGFPGTMRYRIQNCFAAVIFGESRHHAPVFTALAQSSGCVFIEDRINAAELYLGTEYSNYGRGAALLSKVLDFLEDVDAHTSAEPRLQTVESLLPTLKTTNPSSLANFHEDLGLPSDSKYFDVFFSVAPMENRTDGARFQRIRNMSVEFGKQVPTVWLTPNPDNLARRFKLIKSYIQRGLRPRYFYGENSTSPMGSYSRILEVAKIVRYLQENGCSAGWFVRDLHWLSPDVATKSISTGEQAALVERGIFELTQMALVCNVFFAPDEASVSGFKNLLSRTIPSVTWAALPPGVAKSNLLTPTPVKVPGKLTLVYSGGIGNLYLMDLYLDALCTVPPESVRLEFVIREDDLQHLNNLLTARQLDRTHEINILTSSFENYLPRPNTIGVILLDSDYAKLSFPYKTMSTIEKGLPILTYKDMAIGKFVQQQNIGFVVDRSIDGIVNTIRDFVSGWPSLQNIEKAQDQNSWISRVETIHSTLSVYSKPMSQFI